MYKRQIFNLCIGTITPPVGTTLFVGVKVGKTKIEDVKMCIRDSLVSEKTNGRIKIVVKCNGELGDEKSIIEQLKFGGIDFSRVSISSISDDIPELKVIQMPFLYSDAQEMWDVLNGDDGKRCV